MTFKLKNKYLIKVTLLFACFFFTTIVTFFVITQNVWTQYDYKIIDHYYEQAVKYGHGPQPGFSPQIVYLAITDNSYTFFGKNYLDRKDMAQVNMALTHLAPEAVIYDIIFARESSQDADFEFLQSLKNIGSIYLPTALALSDTPVEFQWGNGHQYDQLRSDLFLPVNEKGVARPYYSQRGLLQLKKFSEAAKGSGAISSVADADSVYRHTPILIKIDDSYYPSLSFAVFLKWANISAEEISIQWGTKIVLSATSNNFLDNDVVIPIDEKGNVFVPFLDAMGKDFEVMGVHDLLEYYSDATLRGNLLDIFEGNFVFIGDVSTGSADLGDTSLNDHTPLITIHTSLLNAMLTNTFYAPWPFDKVFSMMLVMCFILIVAAIMKSPWVLYGTGVVLMVGTMIFTWTEFVNFRLFPVLTVGITIAAMFSGLIVSLEWAMSKNRTFIKNTFSKYVPREVVTELLDNPELLKLGGQTRTATILFSDIADFTTVSEIIKPDILVQLLNEYFTEMTNIVLKEKGIIDKYIGDAIMAEFGIPVSFSNHADHAVTAAFKMQRRLAALRDTWGNRGLPSLHCRIGINTGSMIAGNMGSENCFDYTVIGDAVNLTSRIEGANKYYGTSILVSEETIENLTPGKFKNRIVDFIKVKGKHQAVKIYEIYGFEEKTSALNNYHNHDDYFALYDKAFRSYLAKDFSTAMDNFVKSLALRPGDPAASALIQRVKALLNDPPAHDWDGSIKLS